MLLYIYLFYYLLVYLIIYINYLYIFPSLPEVTSLTISFSEYLRRIFNNFTKNVGELNTYLLNYLHETDTRPRKT